MKKYIFFIIVLTAFLLKAEYVEGDMIPDMLFQDTNIDSTGQVVYSQQSTKDLISSGKIIVMSFFGVG